MAMRDGVGFAAGALGIVDQGEQLANVGRAGTKNGGCAG
jgi:hypothetical protein